MRVSIVSECVAREVEWVRVISEVDVQYFYRGSRIARKEICVKIHVAFRPLKIDRGFVWTAGVRNTEEDIVHNPDLAHSAQHHCCRSGRSATSCFVKQHRIHQRHVRHSEKPERVAASQTSPLIDLTCVAVIACKYQAIHHHVLKRVMSVLIVDRISFCVERQAVHIVRPTDIGYIHTPQYILGG